jgi:heptosyltransferase-2
VPQVREWKRRRFDLAVLFQNAFEAALIPFLAGVPLRLGYATESRQALLTHPLPVPDWRSSRHEVFYYLYLVTALEQMLFGHSTVCEAEPDASIQISETRKAEATELLRAFGVNEDDVVVAICPGSINSRAKRWPAESYASLADRLIESKRRVLLIGSKDEMDVSEDVTRRMRERPIVLTGKTTLDQITGILDRADLVVTNDTGPAHLGAALGRPTIVIFGPTNPLTTRPFAPEAVMLRHPPDCAPCMLRDCPIDHRCMTAITVDEVFEQSHALLKRGSFVKTVRSLCDSVA